MQAIDYVLVTSDGWTETVLHRVGGWVKGGFWGEETEKNRE
jgi:hypothetical protein